jgi:hypothetical protein
VPTGSPAGTAESYPGHCPGLPAPNREGSISEVEEPQDCILGHFQPSLRDCSSLESFPRTASWATLSRPSGTQFGEASSHADSKAQRILNQFTVRLVVHNKAGFFSSLLDVVLSRNEHKRCLIPSNWQGAVLLPHAEQQNSADQRHEGDHEEDGCIGLMVNDNSG